MKEEATIFIIGLIVIYIRKRCRQGEKMATVLVSNKKLGTKKLDC